MKKLSIIPLLLVALATSGITWLFSSEKGLTLRKKLTAQINDILNKFNKR